MTSDRPPDFPTRLLQRLDAIGYARTPAAALALLDALARRSTLVAGPMAERVRSLARDAGA